MDAGEPPARDHGEHGRAGCFPGVEAAGCETPGQSWVNTILGNVKRSLSATYHAFAPHSLAEFQYRFNRRYDLAALPQRLLTAAVTALPLHRPILMSVS